MIEELNEKQNSRVAALKVAREVLSEQTANIVGKNIKAVDTIDLVSIAGWIIDGKDPWKPKKRHRDFVVTP